MKITAISLQPRQTRVFMNPISPKITENIKRKRKGSESEEKKTSNNPLFIYCGL